MENEFEKLDKKKESVAIVAGFALVLILGLFTIYSKQKASKLQLADERN